MKIEELIESQKGKIRAFEMKYEAEDTYGEVILEILKRLSDMDFLWDELSDLFHHHANVHFYQDGERELDFDREPVEQGIKAILIEGKSFEEILKERRRLNEV